MDIAYQKHFITILQQLYDNIQQEQSFLQTAKIINDNIENLKSFEYEIEDILDIIDEIINALYIESKTDIYLKEAIYNLIKSLLKADIYYEDEEDDDISSFIINLLATIGLGEEEYEDFSNLFNNEIQDNNIYEFVDKYYNKIINFFNTDNELYYNSKIVFITDTLFNDYIKELMMCKLVFEMILERAEQFEQSVFDTEVFKQDAENINGFQYQINQDWFLVEEDCQNKINSLEKDKNDYISINYTKPIDELNLKLSNTTISIENENNKIMQIQDDYNISKKEKDKISKIIKDIEKRIIHFKDSNFSDDYAYWNKNIIENPDNLNFWIDFIEGDNQLSQFSIQSIGDRPKVINDNTATSIYFKEVPQIIYTSNNEKNDIPFTGYKIINFGNDLNNYFSNSKSQHKSIKDVIDENLYTNSYCAEEINITAMPIYYLQPNDIIYISDQLTNINGKYIIKTIKLPLDYSGNMTINASKVPEQIY